MSKRQYQALALGLHRERPNPYIAGMYAPAEAFAMWQACVAAVADVCAADNSRFDRERFLEAAETGGCKGMKT